MRTPSGHEAPAGATPRRTASALAVALCLCGVAAPAAAQTVATPYNADYWVANLGSVAGLPANNGGLAFLAGDPSTIVIGGEANQSGADLYTISVVRGADNAITGFSGTATLYAAAPYIDGGIDYAPNGVLFVSRYRFSSGTTEIGQIRPGSTTTDKVVDIAALGVSPSIGGLGFVPLGFPGEGQLKAASFNTNRWYTLTFAEDGTGTYDITAATLQATISGGPEGFVYVPLGSPQFTDYASVLVSEWSAGKIGAYDIDGNGDPDPNTRRDFVTGMTGVVGAAIDPLTGDFLFSTFGGGNRVIAVRGFTAPCGNGIVGSGEECDDGNTVDGDCCSATCQLEAAGTECRPAADECDVPETCSGTDGSCPQDGFAEAGTACPDEGNPCTADECDSGGTCAHPAANAGAECRPAAGVCDVAEVCDGVSDTCPGDGFAPPTVECRAAAGACDVAESCTGSDASCPADAKSTAECRAAAGVCDVAETCDGVSDTCPADGFAPPTVECRAAAGACDVAESCTGSGASCPADAKSTAECRPAAGVCDVAETCDGVSDDCPAEGFAAPGTPCRASAGACDVAEACSGTEAACPPDGKRTAVCRPAAGQCDVAEYCDGVGDSCPLDARVPDGTSCDDGDACTAIDQCSAGLCLGETELSCGPCEACDAGAGCVATPWDTCRSPVALGASVLVVKNKSPDGGDLLSWKWTKGEETTTDDFGDPLTDTAYALCIYDDSGAGGRPRVLVSAVAPAGDICAGKPCWKRVTTKGFKYKDAERSPDGIDTITLKSGVDGRAGVVVKAKGEALGVAGDLSFVAPVLVQLRSEDGECWEAVYGSPTRSTPALFKSRSD
jgi:cysteine-rich repeat protein